MRQAVEGDFMSTVSPVQIKTIMEDHRGRVTRTDYDGRTRFEAAGRCLTFENGAFREYHVRVVPTGVKCWAGFDSAQAAIDALDTWKATWPEHARDHVRALRGDDLPLGQRRQLR
jgi:hypothetical protein